MADSEHFVVTRGFGGRLKQALTARGLSQGRLEKAIDYEAKAAGEDPTDSVVNKWTSEKRMPKIENAARMAIELRVNLTWLVLGRGPMDERIETTAVELLHRYPNIIVARQMAIADRIDAGAIDDVCSMVHKWSGTDLEPSTWLRVMREHAAELARIPPGKADDDRRTAESKVTVPRMGAKRRGEK